MLSSNQFTYRHVGTSGVSNISFTVQPGECVVVIGENGSGKSTLLQAIAGLLPAQQGQITWNGEAVSPQKIGIVFQHPDHQFITTSVLDEMVFGLENLKVERSEMEGRVREALALVNMEWTLHAHPQQLSGGEKQRIAIAAILAMQPEVLLLDEVTAMLDPQAREQIYQIIKQLKKQQKTIIYTTHLTEEYAFADRCLLLEKGELRQDITLEELAMTETTALPFSLQLQRACGAPLRNISWEEYIESL